MVFDENDSGNLQCHVKFNPIFRSKPNVLTFLQRTFRTPRIHGTFHECTSSSLLPANAELMGDGCWPSDFVSVSRQFLSQSSQFPPKLQLHNDVPNEHCDPTRCSFIIFHEHNKRLHNELSHARTDEYFALSRPPPNFSCASMVEKQSHSYHSAVPAGPNSRPWYCTPAGESIADDVPSSALWHPLPSAGMWRRRRDQRPRSHSQSA